MHQWRNACCQLGVLWQIRDQSEEKLLRRTRRAAGEGAHHDGLPGPTGQDYNARIYPFRESEGRAAIHEKMLWLRFGTV
jgi:hypothetical protein